MDDGSLTEARERIVALEVENARMRGALRGLEMLPQAYHGHGLDAVCAEVQRAARAALSQPAQPEGE